MVAEVTPQSGRSSRPGWRVVFCVLIFLAAMTQPSCSGRKAEELYKTAQFEELQTNWAHAGQLYEKIVADYPRSEEADRARLRLSELAAEGRYPDHVSP